MYIKDNQNVKFSILVPVYNVEEYLEECINSVINQTYKNFELILINDGSTDSSKYICEKFLYKDKRVKFYNQENRGLIITRRNAIKKAVGEFCLFLDSDDYWEVDLLERIKTEIDKNNCDLLIFKYKRVSETGKFLFESKSIFNSKMIFEGRDKIKLFQKMIDSSELNNLVCKAVKTSIINDYDYHKYKEVRNGEDLLQSLPLIYNAKKIIYINEAMYNYRTTTNSMTHVINPNFTRDITLVRSELLYYLNKLNINDEENIKKFYSFYINSIIVYIRKVMSSTMEYNKKVSIINNAKSYKLYKDGINNIDKSKVKLNDKIILSLYMNNSYRILNLYCIIIENLIKFLKLVNIKNLI